MRQPAGSCPTMSVSTPVVVALAATPAPASTTISMQDSDAAQQVDRLADPALELILTWISSGCGGITDR